MTRARPLVAIALLVVWLLVTALTGRGPEPGQPLGAVVTNGILWQVAFAAAFLIGTTAALRWRGLGLGAPRQGTLRLLWLPALYLLLIAAAAATVGLPPPTALAFLLANMLLVGLSEELMFRGVLFSGLRDRLTPWPAVAITSILFGGIHVLNVGATGHLQGAILQSIAAGMLGLMLMGLRLRMGSIWPAVLVHAVWNALLLLVGLDQPPLPPDQPIPLVAQAGVVAAILPLGLYGLWLLRRIGRDGDGDPASSRARPAGPLDPWGAPRR